MKRNTFPEQTHFIGVLLPEDITLMLEDCRRYMRESYGCKSGYGTPVHVTLVPPFRLPKEYSTSDIAEAIADTVATKGLGFAAKSDGCEPGHSGRCIDESARGAERDGLARGIPRRRNNGVRAERRKVGGGCHGSDFVRFER